jgi:hypothetical protein
MQIDDFTTWPVDVLDRLRHERIVRMFSEKEWIEHIPIDTHLYPIAQGLLKHAYTDGLVGFHCTREPRPDHFAKSGLRLLDPEQSVREFLTEYQYRFSEGAYSRLTIVLHDWLSNRNQIDGRSGKVWFCLTSNSVAEGTEYFFRYFGGEIIYWQFKFSDAEISAVLEQIGNPVVVEAKLSMDTLHCCGDDNFVKSCLSFYGRAVNPLFNLHNIEGYSTDPIAPTDIIRVWDKDEFFKYKYSTRYAI